MHTFFFFTLVKVNREQQIVCVDELIEVRV